MGETGGGQQSVRAKLVDAASRLLIEHSPDQVTTKDIARLAGVNHGQIHHYFGSKHALYWSATQEGALLPNLHGSRTLPGCNDTVLPAPLDPAIAPAWRVLAYLLINDHWKQHGGMAFPNLHELLYERAKENGHDVPTAECVAETSATLALQVGWWLYSQTIIGSLSHFSSDVSGLPDAVANCSRRLLDRSIPTTPVNSPSEVDIATGPEEEDEEPAEVSDRLIWAAYELLADSPPSAVTSKAIAARAGVNHGQIHHYFGSKDRLIIATVDFDSARFVSERKAKQAPIAPIQTLRRPSLWRTFAYLAMAGSEDAQVPTPNITAMVESAAERLGRGTDDLEVLSQVAAIYAMDHGWIGFQELLERAFDPFIDDRKSLRMRLAELSTRLIHQPE